MITSEVIKNRLWAGANELRGAMDASRYKDYMLGLMFYKFLSDKTLETFRTTSGLKKSSSEELVKAYAEAYKQFGQNLTDMINQVLGYHIEPEYLYHKWIEDINNGTFEVQKIIDSLNNFERNIQTTADADDFIGLFSNSNLDLTDTALGSDLKTRSGNIKELILLFADLDMVALQKGDVLGDAYEYLIGQFAMESGKKAGEFYTPAMVSEVMAQIVAKSCHGKITSIYDPTVGSGSLLLTVAKHLDKDSKKNLSYYGQEKNTSTYNLTRMNLLLHDVLPGKMTIKNGDTLAQDWPEDPERPNEGVQFDAVVMNPPYSLKNWNKAGVKVSDPRFQVAGVLPPDNKGDYAFLMHGLYHLGTNGTMAIVLPHGVLFRGASEGTIREKLLEKNYIDAIIGLPNNLFTNTGMDFHHQLKGAILDAVDEGLIQRDPTRKVIIKGKAPREKKVKYLNQFELHTLLAQLDLKDEVNWDWFIMLVAKTGLRFSEALGLTPKDFDFAHQSISVSKTWDYKNGGGFMPTKNKSSIRKVQIDWQTVIQFAELVKNLPEDEPIFVKGKVYNSTINDRLERYCKRANLPVISIHGLRHTHASILLFAGVSIASVARRLGHASMTTTQKTYLHIIQELENRDVDLVMRSLSGLS